MKSFEKILAVVLTVLVIRKIAKHKNAASRIFLFFLFLMILTVIIGIFHNDDYYYIDDPNDHDRWIEVEGKNPLAPPQKTPDNSSDCNLK